MRWRIYIFQIPNRWQETPDINSPCFFLLLNPQLQFFWMDRKILTMDLKSPKWEIKEMPRASTNGDICLALKPPPPPRKRECLARMISDFKTVELLLDSLWTCCMWFKIKDIITMSMACYHNFYNSNAYCFINDFYRKICTVIKKHTWSTKKF